MPKPARRERKQNAGRDRKAGGLQKQHLRGKAGDNPDDGRDFLMLALRKLAAPGFEDRPDAKTDQPEGHDLGCGGRADAGILGDRLRMCDASQSMTAATAKRQMAMISAAQSGRRFVAKGALPLLIEQVRSL